MSNTLSIYHLTISFEAASMQNRIKELRIRAGLTQEQLAELAGTTNQQIGYLENGRRRLSDVWIERLAVALRCSTVELLMDVELLPYIPLLSWDDAGEFPDVVAEGHAQYSESIPVAGVSPATSFALRIKDNSMNRVAREGSLLVVDTSSTLLVDGKCYVFRNSKGWTTFRRYREDPPRLEPDSTEPHETIFNLRNLTIIGQAMKVISDL